LIVFIFDILRWWRWNFEGGSHLGFDLIPEGKIRTRKMG